MTKIRDEKIDILRGLAMLFVILGHTMTGSSTGSENSFVFQVVWSLQMPLFFLISGYVIRYSKSIETLSDLSKYIKKKTAAYFVPWCVWTFIVRGLIFGQNRFFDIVNLLWHMDSGYWFLCSLWMISMLFGMSQYIARKHTGIKATLFTCITYLIGGIFLASIGVLAGFSFLSIKLTLYYMPFFLIGYVYGQYSERIAENIKDIAVLVCSAIWLSIILRVNLYTISDNLLGIALRAIASLSGCIAISGIMKGTQKDVLGRKCLLIIGQHSMEIYLVHNLLLNMIQLNVQPVWGTVEASALTASNYVLTVIVTLIVIHLLNSNRIIRMVLFRKV